MPGAINHRRMDRRSEMVHEVRLTRGSLLSKITGKRTLGVNSTHHQAVGRVAAPLQVTAVSADGVVEGMELKPERGRHCFRSCWRAISSGTAGGSLPGTSGDLSRVHAGLCAASQEKFMKGKILIVDDADGHSRNCSGNILRDNYEVDRSRQRRGAQTGLRRDPARRGAAGRQIARRRRTRSAAANQEALAGNRSHRADRRRHASKLPSRPPSGAPIISSNKPLRCRRACWSTSNARWSTSSRTKRTARCDAPSTP